MYLISVIDDRNGMMFNKRRQSRDRVLCEKILSLAKDGKLLMNTYSSGLFKDAENKIIVDDDFLQKAEKGDYCFCENCLPDEKDVEKITLFKWNRKYPGDYYFNIDLTAWNLTETEEFAGYSHEKITMEEYIR